MTSPATEIVVHDDAATLARQVATDVLGVITSAQAEGREPHLALTGGTIADAIHRELARQSVESTADWSRVHLWWGDERFVPAASPDRNAGQAAAALLDHVPIGPDHLHAMPASDEVADVDAGAAAYAEKLLSVGGGQFDLLMLGVGPDGHVASLFPGFPQLAVTDASTVSVTGSPKPPPERISLTFPALNQARAVWFVVAGAEKADAVRRALADPAETASPGSTDPAETAIAADPLVQETPARGVQGRLQTRWHLDRTVADPALIAAD